MTSPFFTMEDILNDPAAVGGITGVITLTSFWLVRVIWSLVKSDNTNDELMGKLISLVAGMSDDYKANTRALQENNIILANFKSSLTEFLEQVRSRIEQSTQQVAVLQEQNIERLDQHDEHFRAIEENLLKRSSTTIIFRDTSGKDLFKLVLEPNEDGTLTGTLEMSEDKDDDC